MSRRTLLQGGLAGLVLASAGSLLPAQARGGSAPHFVALTHSIEDKLLVPDGYTHNIVIRWGDPVGLDGPEFDLAAQAPAKQALQFGYNCDFIAFMPLADVSEHSTRGLLVVNHEFTNAELMFPDWDGEKESKSRGMVDIELAAHGMTVIEIRREGTGRWQAIKDSPYNRRLSGETPVRLSGPAAGHPWLRTSYDPAGMQVRGTLSNCAGGITPWGTVLSAEENFQACFGGPLDAIPDEQLRALHRRYGVGADRYGWTRYYDRFDVRKEPHEPIRFGWVVEIDPYDAHSLPVKRTALGRMRHEAATVVLSRRGHAVVYMGDDERFEYIYKFVSAGRYKAANRAENLALLDSGTLYAARLRDDGTGEWLPLVFGRGPLTAANGFTSQASVLINARRAADLMGATRMDRPEDIEVHPRTGKVYAVLTNNTRRKPEQTDRANPRPYNKHGHILELVEEAGEHAATRFCWEIFIACGDPDNPEDRASYQGQRDVSWFSCPDNLVFDDRGRMWVTTDGQTSTMQKNDALYLVETEGPHRGKAMMFMSGLPGAEISGPEHTPDNRTFFVAIQHPGQGSSCANPTSHFPDYKTGIPPRPSIVAIYRQDGGKVGD
jgi:secreted PhoX family phosphatase